MGRGGIRAQINVIHYNFPSTTTTAATTNVGYEIFRLLFII